MAEGGKWFEDEHPNITILGKKVASEKAEEVCDQLINELESKLPEEAKFLFNKFKDYITRLLLEIRRSSLIIQRIQASLEETANKTLEENFDVSLTEEDMENYGNRYEWKHILSDELWERTMKVIKEEVMNHCTDVNGTDHESQQYTVRDHHGTTVYKEKTAMEGSKDYIKRQIEDWIKSHEPEMKSINEISRKSSRLPARNMSPTSVSSQVDASSPQDEDERASIDLDPKKTYKISKEKAKKEGKPYGKEGPVEDEASTPPRASDLD